MFAPLSVLWAVLSTGVAILAVLAQHLFDLPVGRRQWAGVGMTAVGHRDVARRRRQPSRALCAGMVAFGTVLLVLGLLLVSGPRMGAVPPRVDAGRSRGRLIGVSDVAVGQRRLNNRLSAARSPPPGDSLLGDSLGFVVRFVTFALAVLAAC